MTELTIAAKISSIIEKELYKKLVSLETMCNKGDLHGFETQLSLITDCIYNQTAEQLLQKSAESVSQELRARGASLRLGKIVERPMQVQLKTGHYIEVKGLYAKKIPDGYTGSRHLLRDYWHLLSGATPCYYSEVALLSVLCPSFEVASHILDIHKVRHNITRVKELCYSLSKRCEGHHGTLSLAQGESLSGKRVVISTDGGRTRTREYKTEPQANGYAQFTTPWVEPKMFVIDVLNKDGTVERNALPLYGFEYDVEKLVDLLGTYLKDLKIEEATQIQIVGDGALWIWNRLKNCLIGLGVKEDNIVETVDYFHASSYIHKIVAALPKESDNIANQTLKNFKQWLWEGKIDEITKTANHLFKNMSDDVKTYLGYFSKNIDRMQYYIFKEKKLMCGSGIIESGIRRVINLRFKNASAFWHKENVKGLFFLRGILVAFRWNIFINNLVKL